MLLGACSERQNTAAQSESAAPGVPVPPRVEEPGETEAIAKKGEYAASPADVDLTLLNSAMVYAEVFNIVESPDKYMGKTIKMSGPYYASYFDETDAYYHYVIVEDASACCSQGLEFIWNGTHNYPADYPADGEKIEVVGEFKSYVELGQTYYYIAADEIRVV
jgi:hypothetical protein